MKSFTEKSIHIIQSIPTGTVMTYGQIAKYAGSPRGARQVVRILHSMSSKYELPWHRVINGKGEIGFKNDEQFKLQKEMLEAEGVTFTKGNTIELEKFRYTPEIPSEE
ncbi:MGMT family protein [Rossellomorea aquimaris]|uniref:MGMT family protein n=1 Tax=Rossellomorea aquimaris TaxID=189382 RepID=UPI001CD1B7CF|nr:MGMT family protein [Rossellomorea aquimaris]MCA1055628.1 MGMT family protein [Rossellomorea aquimaris]